MIDLIVARDYFKQFAEEHEYILHSDSVKARNRFVTYDMDESNTGDGGELSFPRMHLVTDSRFGGYSGSINKTGGQPLKSNLSFEVMVLNKYPNGDYRRHDEVKNETYKVINDLVSYMFEEQRLEKCHPLLKYVDFNTIQIFSTRLKTHGDAIGWAVRFELSARIDNTYEGAIPPPLPGLTTAKGTILYWDGTKWAKLEPGDDGQVLSFNETTEAPEWVDDGGGAQGPQGPPGADGADGANGADGAAGADGKSAYEVAVENGFVGDEAAWLLSLKGDDGAAGATGAQGPAGASGATGATGATGPAGPTAASADANNLARLGGDSLLFVGRTASTSNTIDFAQLKQFGTVASPISGALLTSYTNAINGLVQVIYYTGAITYPVSWTFENAYDYNSPVVNMLAVVHLGNSKARIKVIQASI